MGGIEDEREKERTCDFKKDRKESDKGVNRMI